MKIKPFPNSQKVYVQGSRPDLRVPMRKIAQSPTAAQLGGGDNPDVTVYDTSGPYTDPDAVIDIHKGLPKLRKPWIDERAGRGTQMHYAKKGIVTPEMEFVALR